MKVAILYGWCEGPRLARDLRQTLEESGHTITRNARKADIIIAHSMGCYGIPADAKAQRVLLIGLPYRSWSSFPFFMAHKIIINLLYALYKGRVLYSFSKMLWNSFYFLTRPFANMRLRRMSNDHYLPKGTGTLKVLLVHNKYDLLIRRRKACELSEIHNWQYVLLHGAHDDLWMNPKQYVDLLE